MAEDILEAVQRDVAAQHLKQEPLRLERMHRSGGPTRLANATVWVPILAPTSTTVSPRARNWPSQLDFEIAPFAIQVE
jgi:hypothetical protein